MKKCCLCKKKYDGFGNNAEPLKKGRCCDVCNETKVIPARMKAVPKPEHVFVFNYSTERKRIVKKQLEHLIESRKKEIGYYEENVIGKLKDAIKYLDEAKKGQLPIDVAIKRNERISTWMKAFLGKK